MKTIYKYALEFPEDEQLVPMSVGAELLNVAVQANRLTIWVRLDPNAPLVGRRILMRGTGHSIGDEPFICSIFDGMFVWHFFDGGEAKDD